MIKKIVLMSLLGFFATSSIAADVYKYVDENGNIFYSDQKPSQEIVEDKLKKITIIESSKMNPKSTWQRADHKKSQAASEFEDFVIASPSNDSIFSITDGNMLVMVNLPMGLSPKYRIKFYLDGKPHGKVKSATQLISDIEEGPHTLYAEVIIAKSRQVIKTTPEIKFQLIFKNK